MGTSVMKSKKAKIIGGVVGGIACLGVIGAVASPSTDEPAAASESSNMVMDAEQAVQEVSEPARPSMSVAQENAVESAQSYLRTGSFSRGGLIDQLEYEQYSTKDATFAVDYISPNWKAEAAESAQAYLDTSSFSRQGLIDQLIFEQFTRGQAEYGVNKAGL